jgi:hypothetical protein
MLIYLGNGSANLPMKTEIYTKHVTNHVYIRTTKLSKDFS